MAETISDTLLRLQTIIKNNYPAADIAPGTVLNELVLKLDATLQNPITNRIDGLDQGNSVQAAIASSVDTFNPIIDEIASNYNVVRNQGSRSTGSIKVVVSQNRSYQLRAGFIFTQQALGLSYVTTSDWAAVAAVTNPATQVPVLQNADGTYYFVIPVVANTVGPQYQVSDQTAFTTDPSNTISNFGSAAAYGNFTTGQPLETDKALIARYQAGITNKTLLTSQSISARVQELVPKLQAVSVIGANNAEMTRSKQNLFGISTLGMADVYVRTTIGPETIRITKTGTFVDGQWHISLSSTDAPAFYRIVSLLPAQVGITGTIPIDSTTFGYTYGSFDNLNTINSAADARFTTYQTCDITFTYTPSSDVTIMDFSLLLSYQPNIDVIQQLFLSNAERIACADYLVKAAIPCYVSVDLTVHRKNPNVTFPTASLQSDIFNYINSLKFGDSLYVSQLIKLCYAYDVLFVDLPTTVTGTIYTPSGKLLTISSNDVLTIPTNLPLGVTPNTTLFFADYADASGLNNAMSASISVEVI